MKAVLALLMLLPAVTLASGSLSPDIRISSAALGYDLQYRVYVPDGVEFAEGLPVLFVTDGHAYIRKGRVPRVLDRLIRSATIEPLVAIFVDARDPDNLRVNRRNQEFFCNASYLQFYVDELIPAIERAYPVAQDRAARTILGVSFGGLNAACFGLLGYETFSGIGMHSPVNRPVENLLPAYEQAPKLPLKIFLSTGSPNDNTVVNRKFRKVLQEKGYELKFVQTDAGHNWGNWAALVDDVLLYFYGAEPQE